MRISYWSSDVCSSDLCQLEFCAGLSRQLAISFYHSLAAISLRVRLPHPAGQSALRVSCTRAAQHPVEISRPVYVEGEARHFRHDRLDASHARSIEVGPEAIVAEGEGNGTWRRAENCVRPAVIV